MATLAPGRRQLIIMLLLGGFSTATLAAGTYRWTDAHGQMHYGDNPPARAKRTEIQLPRARSPSASGLRPDEISALQRLEQRTALRQQRARTARRQEEQQLADRRSACREHREQMQQAPGKDGFKTHAEYLRTHCW